MNESEKTKIIREINQAFTQWATLVEENKLSCNFIKNVETIAQASSINVVFHSAPNHSASFIGRYKICRYLQQNFGGKISYIQPHWYWQGSADIRGIKSCLKKKAINRKFSLFFNVSDKDIGEITKQCCREMESVKDINLQSDDEKQHAYIGFWHICHRLKNKLGGKIKPVSSYWIWLGNSDFKTIEKNIGIIKTNICRNKSKITNL